VYIKRDVPVIVTDATDSWPARRLFSLEFLHKVQMLTKLSSVVIHLFLKPVTITYINFVYPALPRFANCPYHCLSFTPNLITVILFTTDSLSLNYPISSRSRTLLLELSLKLLSPVISLPSYALSTGSESLNASNTSSSLLSTKF